MKKLVFLSIICMIIGACSFRVEKRRYFSGYYVSISGPASKHQWKPGSKEPATRPISTVPVLTTNNITPGVDKFPNVAQATEKETIPGRLITSTNKTIPNDAPKPTPQGNSVYSKSIRERPAISAVKPAATRSAGKSDKWFLTLSGIFMASFAAFFKPFIPRTKSLGYLAVNNRKKARASIFLAHVGLAGCGLYLGKNLAEFGLTSTETSTYVIAGAASIATLFYPVRKVKTGIFKNTYIRQKMFSLLLTISGLLLFVNVGNRLSTGNLSSVQYISVISDKFADTASEKIHKLFQSDEKTVDERQTEKIILTVLTAILSLVLSVLVVGGSCALSCNGQETLALLLLIIGLPVVILSSIAIIKAIWKPNKNPTTSAL